MIWLFVSSSSRYGLSGVVAAFAVGNGYHEGNAIAAGNEYIFADKLLLCILQQCTGQQMRFAQYLESIAHAKHFAAAVGKVNDTLHHGAEPGDGAAAEIVTVGKAAGKHNAIIGGEHADVFVFVPKHDDFFVEFILQRILHVSVAVAAGENDDAVFHESEEIL